MTTPSATKRVLVKSYGCQMNVYDAERMTDILDGQGYQATDNIDNADLIILNTCHIREKAADKVYSELGRLRELKAERKNAGQDFKIVVAGCVAQAEGKQILRREPAVDLVIGPQSYQNLPELLARKSRSRHVDTEFPVDDKFKSLPSPSNERAKARGVSAFVTIQEGCDKFCTFCVVPYTRGSEYSRPVADVLAEVKRLTDVGIREVTLLGQNVNAYHGLDESGHSASLGELLKRVSEISGIARIRYTTSHPLEMDENLAFAHRDIPEVMPYLHLPVQSGSDKILGLMNRRHTMHDYLDSIAMMRRHRNDIVFSSDFIVGFPGETDEDFQATLTLIEEVGFASAYSFKYSVRPGTPAAEMDDQIPEDVKDRRLQILQALIAKQQRRHQDSMVGKTLDILVERKGRYPGQMAGKSPHLLAVAFDAPSDYIGRVVQVRITDSVTNSLVGTLV
ncbi:MAG: tRNA (N6-isopentenyl adenosine(37)-C2)-methylthiotransferase MiaB [Alphaproteobacteria bacterium]|nr:tRNA (N6-isopentenyl adenosine(37)-C2)-methylthiotransferase MiaB [Alphaproteobacteria bacterium]